MLLAKEENVQSDYPLKTLQDPNRFSAYMPPIKSSEKLTKHFLSPSQFNSAKRIPPFPFQQTPKREPSAHKLEVTIFFTSLNFV
jgi:hypothetical protein